MNHLSANLLRVCVNYKLRVRMLSNKWLQGICLALICGLYYERQERLAVERTLREHEAKDPAAAAAGRCLRDGW